MAQTIVFRRLRVLTANAGLILAIALQTISAADLSGHYYLRNLREVGSELILKPDGTYEFALAYGAADYWSKGKWALRDGVVYLNSDNQEEPQPFRLLHSRAAKSGAIRVRVNSPQGRAVPNIEVALLTDKEKHYARTDADGIAVFPSGETPYSAAFRIRVYKLETELYELNHSHDDFTFELNGEALASLRFTDERLTVKGGTLIMHYWGPDQDMHYTK